MRDMQRTPFPALLLGLVVLFTGACAGSAPRAAVGPASGVETRTDGLAARPAVRKVLTIADSYEASGILEQFIPGRANRVDSLTRRIVHENLVITPRLYQSQPQLAVELPSFEKGTWRINPDGTMDTTWRLRPNVKWHDGQPFTSADLVFTFRVNRDTEIAGVAVLASDRLIESVSAPDDLTFVMHWNAPYVDGDITGVGDIVPKHLFEEMYLADKARLATTSLTSTEFVGLGPYRLMKWDRGSSFEVARFDDYYRGRPPLDTIYVRFITDPNTMVANILAETVDVVVSYAAGGVSLDQAVAVQERWVGTKNQALILRGTNVYWAEPQYRAEFARPANTMNNLAVRKALLQAIDLQGLSDVMTHGLSPTADSYFSPGEPRRAEMEPHIAKHPFDRNRALQLLVDAGWQRGPDGVFARDGQRFEIEFWARAGVNEKVASIVADDWNRIGISAAPFIIPATRATDREYEAKRPAFLCCVTVGVNSFYGGKLHQRQINTAATNWTGLNYGGYINPRADSLLDQLDKTLDPRARLPLEQQLVNEYSSDVAMVPLWWQVLPQLMLAGVKGPQPWASSPTANIFEWDRE